MAAPLLPAGRGRLANPAQFSVRGVLSFRCEFRSVLIEYKHCDCADVEEARQAVAAMCAAEYRPMVACRCCACVPAARRVAATWARAVPSNFVAWVDEGRRAACLTSRYVYERLRSGALRATRSPRLSLSDGRAFAAAFAEARKGYALLVDVDSLGAVA